MLYDPRYTSVDCAFRHHLAIACHECGVRRYLARYLAPTRDTIHGMGSADAERYLEAAEPEEPETSDLAVEWRLSARHTSLPFVP